MNPKSKRLREFVVLPPRGLTSKSMEIGLFQDERKEWSLEEMLQNELIGGADSGLRASAVVSYATARSRERPFAFQLLQAFNADGPVLAKVAPVGERLLRAAGYRVVPVTRYRLTSVGVPVTLSSESLDPGSASVDFLRAVSAGIASDGGARGAGVTVGIVDTGVDNTHPALRGRIPGGRCTVVGEDNLDHGACSGPKGGHGTHVAGIIGMVGEDGGPSGIAPEADLRSYRVFPKHDVDKGATNAAIIAAVRSAVDDGCHVINLSLGGGTAKEDGVRDAINYAWDNGVLCICAVGNKGRKPVSYPAAHNNAVAVSALGNRGLIPDDSADRKYVAAPFGEADPDVFLASFSNVRPQVDFAGPGVWIVSTLPGGAYGAMSGTSMAAPAVTGMAAVVLSRTSDILTAPPESSRAEALYRRLVAIAKPYRLGSFDYEGYGVPQ